MEHWDAWCNLGGSLLGALGGLYLTYDILGGKDGPLAGVTRVVTYVVLFGIAYSFGLGLKFGLVASLGMGLNLGVDFQLEARRIHAKAKPRRRLLDIFFAISRAAVLSLALMVVTNGAVGLRFFPLCALFVSMSYLLGFSPAANHKPCRHPDFETRDFTAPLIRGLSAGLAYWLALYLAMAVDPAFPSSWRVGLTVGGASFFIDRFTPTVEWWMDHLSRKLLAVVGVIFAIAGFLIQALPNWIILLR